MKGPFTKVGHVPIVDAVFARASELVTLANLMKILQLALCTTIGIYVACEQHATRFPNGKP